MTDETDEKPDNAENEYSVFFSLRITPVQRRRLRTDAGSQTVGEYVRSRLFENRTPLKRTFRRPVQDEQALTKVLGALGRSRLSSNLNQLAKAVHSGSLPITPETEKAILEACAAIQSMNGELVKALGIHADIENVLPPEAEK